MAAPMQTFIRKLANFRLISNQRTVQASTLGVQQIKYCSTDTAEDFSDPRDEYEEWEIKQIRNVSRLPRKDILERRVNSKNQFEAFYKRPQKIEPKWPSKTELQVMKEYEAEFEPSVETMLERARESKLSWETKNTKRILTVEKNMENMEKMIKDLKDKEIKQEQQRLEDEKRREERIEAVRKQLGTRLRPNDARVKALLIEKEKAELKAEKLRKKREKEAKMAEKLKVLAQTE